MTSQTIALLMAGAVGTGTALLTIEELAGIHKAYANTAAGIQEKHDRQTLEMARMLCEIDGGPANAAEEELVARGYLKPEWLEREKVQVPE